MAIERIVRVTAGIPGTKGVTLTGAKMGFNIERSERREPNKARLTIANLDRRLRSLFEQEDLIVQIEVGYAGRPLTVLFTGDLVEWEHKRGTNTWDTTLQLGDAERTLRDTRVSLSQSTPLTVNAAFALVAAELRLGARLGSVEAEGQGFLAPLPTDQIVNGIAFHGRAADILERLATSYGFAWSVQNGVLQVTVEGEGVPQVSAVVLTPQTGLVGTPQRIAIERRGRSGSRSRSRPKKRNGVALQAILDPEILMEPGRPIVVNEPVSGVNGIFVVKRVAYTGDSAGDPAWFQKVEAEERPNATEG